MIEIVAHGNFDNTERFLQTISRGNFYKDLENFAREGEDALSNATPADTGETARSWYSEVTKKNNSATIAWLNSHKDTTGVPIAILIEYGHMTRQHGYVQPYEFINKALQELLDRIANDVWKVVTSA